MSDERLRGFARRSGISRAVKGAFRRMGFDLLRRHYYSPIPDLAELPADLWSRESDLPGVAFDMEDGLDFIRGKLAVFLDEYRPPTEPSGNLRQFHLRNGFYEELDAETLYAMVRHLAPSRIVELGSGYSTLVIADALARDDRPGQTDHRVYDPFPQAELMEVLDQLAEVSPIAATEIPLSEFDALGAGDILFVDTTHTVRTGGDANRIILEVLPRLSAGVYIHFHDIYLPWEYPREFLTERSFFWAEQYLLQAFLAFNREFEIVFGTQALQRRFPDRLSELIPSAGAAARPSAFWLRRADR